MYSQTPQYRRSWAWRKIGGIPKTAVKGVIYNYNIQNPSIWDLEMGGGSGKGGIEGDNCNKHSVARSVGTFSEFVISTVSLHP